MLYSKYSEHIQGEDGTAPSDDDDGVKRETIL
jgi:hypothetical protein